MVISSHKLPFTFSTSQIPRTGLGHLSLGFFKLPLKTWLIKTMAGYHGRGCHWAIGKEVIVIIRNMYSREGGQSVCGVGCLAVFLIGWLSWGDAEKVSSSWMIWAKAFFSTAGGWLLVERITFVPPQFVHFRSSFPISSLHSFYVK